MSLELTRLTLQTPPGGESSEFHMEFFADAENAGVGGKSQLTHDVWYDIGDKAVITADFLVFGGTREGAIFLMDLENLESEGGEGLQLGLKDGLYPFVNSSKIDHPDAVRGESNVSVSLDKWFNLTWGVKLGEDGQVLVALDGDQIIDSTGVTAEIPYDIVQVGVTVNRSDNGATVLMKNFHIVKD